MDLRVLPAPPADGELVLRVEGSIDISSRHELLRVAEETFTAEIPKWVVDLSGVSFMDSTGISTLVLIANNAEDAETTFALRNCSPTVARILQVTGLSDRWPDA